MTSSIRRGRRPARIGVAALWAVVCLAGAATIATPAFAADGVDLTPSTGQVTFGAGSAVVLHSFAITNSGTATATGVIVTFDLVSETPTPALTFTGQINGCALVSPSRLSCPLPDIDPAGSTTTDFVAKAIEAHPVPGGFTPTPMSMRVKVTVASTETDLTPDGIVITSDPILRTVHSGATDWVAAVQPVDLDRDTVGQELLIQVGFANRGPAGGEQGETVLTFVAPPGTVWNTPPFFDTCAPVRPQIELRCTTGGANPPDQDPIEFFRIELTIVSTPIGIGTVSVQGMGGELKPADNVARIAVAGAPTPTPVTTATTGPAAPTPPSGPPRPRAGGW